MAGNTVGEAIYKISVDTTELKSGLSKVRSEVETNASSFSKLVQRQRPLEKLLVLRLLLVRLRLLLP
jgi:hypothetical protein